jgi:hypothetical protein
VGEDHRGTFLEDAVSERCPYCDEIVPSVALHLFTCPKTQDEDPPATDAPVEAAALTRGRRAEDILRRLATAKHVTLGDLVYAVKDREGEGWDGPAVTAWSKACVDLAEFLREFPE